MAYPYPYPQYINIFGQNPLEDESEAHELLPARSKAATAPPLAHGSCAAAGADARASMQAAAAWEDLAGQRGIIADALRPDLNKELRNIVCTAVAHARTTEGLRQHVEKEKQLRMAESEFCKFVATIINHGIPIEYVQHAFDEVLAPAMIHIYKEWVQIAILNAGCGHRLLEQAAPSGGPSVPGSPERIVPPRNGAMEPSRPSFAMPQPAAASDGVADPGQDFMLVEIRQAPQTWNASKLDPLAQRNNWPFPELLAECRPDLRSLRQHLESQGLGATTIAGHLQGVHYFFCLLEIKGDFQCADAICGLYKMGILRQILALPVLNAKRSWTQKIAGSFTKLVEIMKTEAYEMEDLRVGRYIGRYINLFETNYVKPLVGRTSRGKDVRQKEREERDGDRLDQLLPIGDIKDLVRQSMIDLKAADYALRHESLRGEANWIHMASVAMTGIVFMGQQAGRPGEWAKVTKRTIQMSYPSILCMRVCVRASCSISHRFMSGSVPVLETMNVKIPVCQTPSSGLINDICSSVHFFVAAFEHVVHE